MWDRVMLDACIPADSRIEVWCRAADERVPMASSSTGDANGDEVLGGWTAQPRPYLRADGAELPWLRAEAVRVTRREAGTGTWELLLQNARGRYLQLRLRLSGNGTVTPWVRALRAWYPRFSYPQRFLPAVYREDPFAGSFIDRFLANMEGINTTHRRPHRRRHRRCSIRARAGRGLGLAGRVVRRRARPHLGRMASAPIHQARYGLLPLAWHGARPAPRPGHCFRSLRR